MSTQQCRSQGSRQKVLFNKSILHQKEKSHIEKKIYCISNVTFNLSQPKLCQHNNVGGNNCQGSCKSPVTQREESVWLEVEATVGGKRVDQGVQVVAIFWAQEFVILGSP